MNEISNKLRLHFRRLAKRSQHFNTISCNIVGHNMFGHPVAICFNMLDLIWKRSNFSCNILDFAWCTPLATSRNIVCTWACALGPFVSRQSPRAQRHRRVALKILSAFGQSVQHLSQHHASMLQDVALKSCERLARPSDNVWTFV